MTPASTLMTLAKDDIQRSSGGPFDMNPYSTAGSRKLWQDGFDNKPLSMLNHKDSFNGKCWQRGRFARILLDGTNSPTWCQGCNPDNCIGCTASLSD